MATGTIRQSADYIIEQGTRDIWNYRKWSSGIAECWCTANGDVASGWSTGSGILKTLPFTFVTVDYGTVQFHNYQISRAYTVLTRRNATTISVQTNSDSALDASFSLDVRGTWK